MADPSCTIIHLYVKKNQEVLTDTLKGESWEEFRNLVCAASYDLPGTYYEGNRFEVIGRWSYVYGFQWTETRAYLKWLFEHGYSGVRIDYDESERGVVYAGSVDLDLNTDGSVYEVKVAAKYWDPALTDADKVAFLGQRYVCDVPKDGPQFLTEIQLPYEVDMATGKELTKEMGC